MSAPVYDKHAQSYDHKHQEAINASGYEVTHFYEYKVAEISRILTKKNIKQPEKILDFGCGVGNVDPYIRKYFPNAKIYGVDISEESIKLAKEKYGALGIEYAAYDVCSGEPFPFDTKFDLIFISCVLQHVPKAIHHFFMPFFKRNMNPGGYLFMFEHNPYNPVTRTVFTKWDRKIDRDADLYTPRYFKELANNAGLKVTSRRFTVFFPKLLSALTPLEKFMGWIPFGAQYYIVCHLAENLAEN